MSKELSIEQINSLSKEIASKLLKVLEDFNKKNENCVFIEPLIFLLNSFAIDLSEEEYEILIEGMKDHWRRHKEVLKILNL